MSPDDGTTLDRTTDPAGRNARRPAAFPRADLLAGMRRTLPVAIGVGIYGVVLGIIAQTKGMTLFELTLMGAIVFAGSAQFVAADLWLPSLPVAEIVLAALVINLRYLLVGASLRPVFAGRPLWAKLVGMHLVADENWAVTMAENRRKPVSPGFLLGGGLILAMTWIGGSMAGHVLGGGLPAPETLGLDFAFSAAFIALAIGLYRDRKDLLLWTVAALVATVAAQLLPGKWYILAGSLAGAAVAAFLPARAGR